MERVYHMRDLRGKKLLIIGSDAGDLNIVLAAKQMGVYTIVADGIADRAKTPAKVAADEAWDVNYSDTDLVVKKCREAGVDGVFAAYSENRVLAACRIAARLGTPFYATEEQVNITRNKRLFKELCAKYAIPTPRDYCFSYPMSDEEKKAVEYPVIVKPADSAGRKGISVCYSADELDEAIDYAVSKSLSKSIVIEDYLSGVEFASVYTVADGKISLSAVNEKNITDDQEVVTGLCDFLISPASSYHRYLEELDAKVRDLIRGIDIQNGVVFFQGMVTDKKIYIFEMGYRINGNNDFYIIEKYNGINFMKMMISYSLCGEMGDDLSRDNPLYPQYACSLLFYAHAGTIGTMRYEELTKHPKIMDVKVLQAEGLTIAEDGSTGQCVLRLKLFADTLEEVVGIVEYAQKHMVVNDVDGNNMLFKPYNARALLQ